MDIEKIIRAWKAEVDEWETSLVASPVGRELSEEELLAVSAADCGTTIVCTVTCGVTCIGSCAVSICAGANTCSTTVHTL